MTIDDWFLHRARVSGKSHRRVSMDDKMTFFQQLSALITSGTPLLRSLELCAEQTQSERLRTVLYAVAGRVSAGCSLHAALADHPRWFEDHWLALIGTGEASGKMGPVLRDLNEQIRETRDTQRKITGALTYPAILLVVSVGVVAIMLWFVVPTFSKMFDDMGTELPQITRFVLSLSDAIVAYGLYACVGVILLAFWLRRYLRTDAGRRRFGSVGMSLPMIGELLVQSAMYRFSSNLALLLRSGVPMLDTLTALSATFRSNPIYGDAILRARSRVAAGRPLADALEESRLFTGMLTNMVRVGEESAALPGVMAEIAPYYKEKMSSFLAKVTKLMEPCIIVMMGFTIALMMLAIYIPMFEMAGKVQ